MSAAPKQTTIFCSVSVRLILIPRTVNVRALFIHFGSVTEVQSWNYCVSSSLSALNDVWGSFRVCYGSCSQIAFRTHFSKSKTVKWKFADSYFFPFSDLHQHAFRWVNIFIGIFSYVKCECVCAACMTVNWIWCGKQPKEFRRNSNWTLTSISISIWMRTITIWCIRSLIELEESIELNRKPRLVERTQGVISMFSSSFKVKPRIFSIIPSKHTQHWNGRDSERGRHRAKKR